jgi:hypothetical protein
VLTAGKQAKPTKNFKTIISTEGTPLLRLRLPQTPLNLYCHQHTPL